MHIAFLINKKPNEKILYVLKRHSITFVPFLFLFLILVILPVAVYLLFLNLEPNVLTGDILYPLLVLLGSIYYLGIFLFFYSNFTDFYLDVWIITDDRIIDIEQHGLLARSTSETELHRIQDVTDEVKGIFPTLFKYGNVIVKTASDTQDIVFRNVPFPGKIRGELIKLARQDRRNHLMHKSELENKEK
ncbi:MAG: PH domain-containing protein [Candidatus Magasanikbacteria bacterium]|nr:PH domain-containing protein [Candidatus Magasanikbacteria bacterium]